MKSSTRLFSRLAAIAFAAATATAAPIAGFAQPYGPPPPFAVPYYDAARHVLSGIVTYAAPYRLTLQVGRGGNTVSVDLKNGTTIVPVGTTLTPGMHVGVRGYWSNGTFIANHVRLR